MEESSSKTSGDEVDDSLDIKPPQVVLLPYSMSRQSRSRTKRDRRCNFESESSSHRHSHSRSNEYYDNQRKHRHYHKHSHKLSGEILDSRKEKHERRSDNGERAIIKKSKEKKNDENNLREDRILDRLRVKIDNQEMLDEANMRREHLLKSECVVERRNTHIHKKRYSEKKRYTHKKRYSSRHSHDRKKRRADKTEVPEASQNNSQVVTVPSDIESVIETACVIDSPAANSENVGEIHEEEVAQTSSSEGEEECNDSSGTQTAETNDSCASVEHESVENNNTPNPKIEQCCIKSDEEEENVSYESIVDDANPLAAVGEGTDVIPFITDNTESDVEEEDYPPYFPGIQGCRSVEQFQFLNKIEEGSYGVVYRARDKQTEDIVALKKLKMGKEKEGFPITSLREINTLLKSQHPNIVTVREIVVGSNMDKIYIVMDFVEQDLKTLMGIMKKRNQCFMQSEIKCLMQQLLLAVAHLHDNWILHRDLKTSNLLLSDQGVLKVGDFGLAREYGSPLKNYTPVVVTLWYRSPELLLCTKQYSTYIDLWSVGCVFGELLTMEPLFPGKSETEQILMIFKDLGTPNDDIWPGYSKMPAVQKMSFPAYPVNQLWTRLGHVITDMGMDLMNKFLTYNPPARITAEAALGHSYFQEAPVPTLPAKNVLEQRKPSKKVLQSDGFHMEKERLGFSLKF